MKIAPRSPGRVFTTSESAPRRMPGMKASILVVEDEPQLRGLLRLTWNARATA